MENQKHWNQKYILASLILHASVLFSFAALTYIESLNYPPYSLGGLVILFSLFTGGFGLVAVWLLGEYHSGLLRPARLTIWGGIHTLLLLPPIVVLGVNFMLELTFQSLLVLLRFLLLVIPPILIIIFARRESP
jgi:hypothetical protein